MRLLPWGGWLLVLLWVELVVAASSYQEIARELMSPACPGKLLIDCTSGEAKQLQQLIRQKLRQGQSKEEIIDYFVQIYGEKILAAPPKRGFYWMAWALPFLALVYAALIMFFLLRIWRRRALSYSTVPAQRATGEGEIDGMWGQRLEEELKDFSDF